MVLFIFTFEATIVKSFFGTARLTLFARPGNSRLHRNSCGRHGAGQTAVSDDVVESTDACANTVDRNFVRRAPWLAWLCGKRVLQANVGFGSVTVVQ